MRVTADHEQLESAVKRLATSFTDIGIARAGVSTLLSSIGRVSERATVEIALNRAEQKIARLAADHTARAGVIVDLDGRSWRAAIGTAPTVHTRRGADGRPTGSTQPPVASMPAVLPPSRYNPYLHLVDNRAAVTAAGHDACVADHIGGGSIVGPDGRSYPLAYPEFTAWNGQTHHLGLEAASVGGNWTVTARAAGLATVAEGNPWLSGLAAAVALAPPTSSPLPADAYSYMVLRSSGAAALAPSAPQVSYEIADIPDDVAFLEPDTVFLAGEGYVDAAQNRAVRRTVAATKPLRTSSQTRLARTAMGIGEGGALALDAFLSGAATYDYEVNRATRAYVVLFEESTDGRLRARFIEHQLWSGRNGTHARVRSAGVFVGSGGVARTPISVAPEPPYTIAPLSEPAAATGPAS